MTQINIYSFGSLVIDGKEYKSDVIIYPDRVDAPWWRKTGHRICMEDLREILAARPEIIILGTGAAGMMHVPEEIKEAISAKGIELRCLPTTAAAKEFNRLSGEKRVVAGLHLTC